MLPRLVSNSWTEAILPPALASQNVATVAAYPGFEATQKQDGTVGQMLETISCKAEHIINLQTILSFKRLKKI